MANWNNRKSSDRSCWSPKPTSVLPQIRFDMHMPATHGSILLHDWESKAVYLCSSRSAEAAAAALVVDLVAGRRTTAPYFLVSPERTSFTHFARPESPSASWRFVRAEMCLRRERTYFYISSLRKCKMCVRYAFSVGERFGNAKLPAPCILLYYIAAYAFAWAPLKSV